MKCPNCNETDHEPTAKYCHVCGTILNTIEPYETEGGINHERNQQIEAQLRKVDKEIQRMEEIIGKLEAKLADRAAPIQEDAQLSNSFVPKGLEAIDLGLPSGTKWASCNVGATRPEEYGFYYAWGETMQKDAYDWNTYSHCDGSGRFDSCYNIGESICGTQYDAAYVNMGRNWRMPTNEQFHELISHCIYTSKTIDDVNGILLTGINGNSIFLPASGTHVGTNIYNKNLNGYYWSGSQDFYNKNNAHAICFFFIGHPSEVSINRYCGNLIRPVFTL